jgi:hypothetical protein
MLYSCPYCNWEVDGSITMINDILFHENTHPENNIDYIPYEDNYITKSEENRLQEINKDKNFIRKFEELELDKNYRTSKLDNTKLDTYKYELPLFKIQNQIKVTDSEIVSPKELLVLKKQLEQQQETLSWLNANQNYLDNQLHQKQNELDQIKLKQSIQTMKEQNEQINSKIKLKKIHVDKLEFEIKNIEIDIANTSKEISNNTKIHEEKNVKLDQSFSDLKELTLHLEKEITHEQKQKEIQEKELTDLRTERFNFISKNKQNHEMEQQIQKYRTILQQITKDKQLCESEIKNQMRLLEEESQKRETRSEFISQN